MVNTFELIQCKIFAKFKIKIMILERTKKEIVIRLPLNVDLSELQAMLDYLSYKELSSKSKAKQSDADTISSVINKSIMKKVKEKRAL